MAPSVAVRNSVLIVDDHPTFCEGLAALLQRTDDFVVAEKVWSSGAALAAARDLQPTMILLDVALGSEPTGGLDLVHQLRRICPQTKIAILTGSSLQEHLMTALRDGVEGYLMKDLAPSALIAAIRQIRDGERVIGSPQHLTYALTQLQEIVQERARVDYGFTNAELEMLRLAAAGYNNREIGAQQFWSEITVKRKMQSVYRKLGVSTRAQAVAEAIRRGFV
jgi:two-component system nitrate/nitrite response regulator NarL